MFQLELIISIVLMFGTPISLLIKIDKHFDYFKLLYPDKFDGLSSYTETMRSATNKTVRRKTKKIGDLPFFLMLMPLFIGRNYELENENSRLQKLGNQIQLALKTFWILLILMILFLLMKILLLK